MTTETAPATRDLVATGGRVLLAAIFVASGAGKLADPAGTAAYIASAGLPLPILGAWAAIAVELLGGIALILGLRVRAVAALLAVFSLVTAVFFHAQFADQNQMIHFLKNLGLAGGLLQVVAFGGGRFSLDRK
jgi:putative oxidoreductase